MRSFISGSFSLMVAIALGALGFPLALWVTTAFYRADVARDWAVWVTERSPLPPYAAPLQVANDAIQRDTLVAAGMVAAVLCLMALSSLRSARRALRSADESHDGKATIELKTRQLRVGRPVEGTIWLTQGSARGRLYRVELSCRRDHGAGRSAGGETAYSEELEVEAVPTPVGWSLPFSFVVPPIAPPSGVNRYASGPGYRWRLAVQRSQGWMALPSVFTLDLAPAPADELRALEKGEPGRREPGLTRTTDGVAPSTGRDPLFRDGTLADAHYAPARPVGNGGKDPLLHERPEFRDPAPTDDPDAVPDQPSLFGRILKWLFTLLFGVVFAASVVALAAAVVLGYL